MTDFREQSAAGGPIVMIDARKIEDSGIGTYIRNVVPRVIARLPRIGFKLLGSVPAIETLVGPRPNCRPIECPVKPLSVREQLQLPGYITQPLDLFWAPHFNIPLSYRGRLLVTIHDIMPMAVPALSGGPLHAIYVRAMTAAIRRCNATVIAVSEFTASELRKRAHISAKQITVIHEAADESWEHVQRNARPHARPYLLYVGLVKPHKNLLTLMKAFELLHEKLPIDLVIVGDRDRIVTRDEESARYAERFGDRAVFTGRVSDERLEQFVAYAEALVVPSLYEGFGLPCLEAMACGCPVIASRAASLPEVCGGAALLFDPNSPTELADAIRQVVENPEQARTMTQRGREQASRFSWDRAAVDTAALIESLVATSRTADAIAR